MLKKDNKKKEKAHHNSESKMIEILTKLFNFYKSRYSTKKEVRIKFNEAVKDLIRIGDISYDIYLNFCTKLKIKPLTNTDFKSMHDEAIIKKIKLFRQLRGNIENGGDN